AFHPLQGRRSVGAGFGFPDADGVIDSSKASLRAFWQRARAPFFFVSLATPRFAFELLPARYFAALRFSPSPNVCYNSATLTNAISGATWTPRSPRRKPTARRKKANPSITAFC